ncbi:MAG: hypothetical protein ACXACP_00410 [Candidatus Hodarchaeales archaeon]|jgi:hypothetical protein
MENLETVALGIFQAIFNNQSTITLDGEDYRINETRTGLLSVN